MPVTHAIPIVLTISDMLLIIHRIFLNFSIRGRGVNELSNKDMQSKKPDLRYCRVGHSIMKWNSVSSEFNGRNLKVHRWYGVLEVQDRPLLTCSGRYSARL